MTFLATVAFYFQLLHPRGCAGAVKTFGRFLRSYQLRFVRDDYCPALAEALAQSG